jgi:hypothetical protein
MLELLLGVGLLALAACMVVLFAMVGELASRLPTAGEGPWVRPIEDARIGHAPASWPQGLLPEFPADDEREVLLVLSTVCESCRAVAAELSSHRSADRKGLGLVLSTGNRENGEAFLQEFNLGSFRHAIDEGGGWTTTELGVRISPAGVLVENGVIARAFTFSDLDAFLGHVMESPGGKAAQMEVSES